MSTNLTIGITGTRHGCTSAQEGALMDLLLRLNPKVLRHGECVGVDAEAATMAYRYFPECRIISHPPIDQSHRAHLPFSEIAGPPKTHFARNRDIVNSSDVMIGVPYIKEEPIKYESGKGGTVYTCDFSIYKAKKPTFVIWPDGTIAEFNIFSDESAEYKAN